jgi:ATP-binding cassette subfamily B protein
LSGGQRPRVANARAMVRDAPLLILDEPTTGLVAESTQRVLGPMRRLMQKAARRSSSRTTSWTLRGATEIVVLEHGRVVQRGSHAELLARGGAYAQMWLSHDGEVALAAAPAEP